MPEQVRYRTKLAQSGTRYRTKIRDAGVSFLDADPQLCQFPFKVMTIFTTFCMGDSPLNAHAATVGPTGGRPPAASSDSKTASSQTETYL
jgi:hypothetical protein